jgi:hypothetical protein
MEIKKRNYKYLLRLYSIVEEYLTSIPTSQENLPDIVLSFCIVIEKMFKIKLYQKNPVLIFENSKIRENDALVAIINEDEQNIESIKIGTVVNRYKLMFKNEFSESEMQVILDIYKIRNHFIHGYKSDDIILSDSENIIKKMGTVWEKISSLATLLFGGLVIKSKKPKNKYSDEELEKVLIEEVKKKIKTRTNMYLYGTIYNIENANTSFLSSSKKCPRCGLYGFSNENFSNDDILSDGMSSVFTAQKIYNTFNSINNTPNLYKCRKCNLELTEKEYEIARGLRKLNDTT